MRCGLDQRLDAQLTALAATGTFTSLANSLTCVPWTPCQPGTFIESGPTSTTDRICSQCGSGMLSHHQSGRSFEEGLMLWLLITCRGRQGHFPRRKTATRALLGRSASPAGLSAVRRRRSRTESARIAPPVSYWFGGERQGSGSWAREQNQQTKGHKSSLSILITGTASDIANVESCAHCSAGKPYGKILQALCRA